ncbi:MAG: tetratricopeptide repeat protein [Saprospiraceae bacterium]
MAARPAKKTLAPQPPIESPAVAQPPVAERLFSHPLAGIFAAVLAILLYTNTLGHGYCLDDIPAISKNEFVKQADFGKIFTTEYRAGYAEGKPGMLYRPLTLAVFAVEWMLSPDSPGFYHLVNVLFYALLGWLLWVTWRRVLAGSPAWLVAVAVWLFVAHPAHTEVVANIKSLDEVLALIFCTAALRSLWLFHENGDRKNLFFSMVLYAGALFSKESAIVFLAVFPLATYFFTDKKLFDNLKTCALFVLPAALFLAMRSWVLSQQTNVEAISALDNVLLSAPDFASRLATAFLMCWKYLTTVIFPHPLVSDMGAAQVLPVQFSDFQALAGLVVFVGAFGWAIWQARQKQVGAFAVLFFGATFSLSSNLFYPIGTSYGERLLFTPLFGFALLVAFALLKIKEKNRLPAAAVNGIVVALVILYGLKTINRNPDWKNSFLLAKADVATSPESARLNFHYALELLKTIENDPRPDIKTVQTAIEHCNKALLFYPNYYTVKETRGLANYMIGQKDRALQDFKEFLEKEPRSRQIPPKLARIYAEKGDIAAAESVLKRSIEAGVQSFDNYLYLGIIYFQIGRKEEALSAFKSAQKIKPQDPAVQSYIEQCEAGNAGQ